MKQPRPAVEDRPDAARLDLPALPGLAPEVEHRVERFIDLLLRWNARINLVADRDPVGVRTRHVADSLQLLPLLPQSEAPLADLGSGGGFPGLVLAMATTRPVHLVESDRRKAAFLTEAVAQLGLRHVQVHPQRIEAAQLPPIGVLTARALAPLTTLLPHAARLLAPGGVAIFPKGRTADSELRDVGGTWRFAVECYASRTEADATILRLRDIAPA